MKSGARGAIVVVAICSWFAISNHCAFAALAAKTDTESHGCPFHSKPKEKPSGEAQCCKILRAVTPAATKSWARDDAKLSNAGDCWSERAFAVTDSQTTPAPLLLDTGPPNAHSFAELILQRSLLAHAPPSLA
jgi:hypothetical protein